MAKNKKDDNTKLAPVYQLEYSKCMQSAYIDYAMDVITDRALPDVRDGLKPVHRRILYAMGELGLFPDKPYKKSARIVGEVLGKFHPHGDSSVYDAMVRMAQDFKMGMPLIDGHGNWGSIDGDGAAAFRYTEARLTPMAIELLKELDKNIVEFKDNFDGTEQEPKVIPSLLPNLLINGCDGIAVGMKTNIPPHNISELLDCLLAYLSKPKMTITEMMKYIPAPDYPTGGIIINKDDMLSLYEKGEGQITIRSKYHLEEGQYGKKNIVFTEIPFTQSGSKSKLIEDIAKGMKDKKVPSDITDIRDESDRDGIRILIEVKKDTDIDNILNYLFNSTSLQSNHNCNFLVLNNKKPQVINLKEYFDLYLAFQKEITLNKHKVLLEKAKKRLEIVEGLLRANDCIDVIIEMLRGSKSLAMAKKCLTTGDISDIDFKTKKNEKLASKFDFSDVQAQAILDLKLMKLINLEINKFIEEKYMLEKDIEKYNLIISDEKELIKYIKKYIKDYRKVFDIPRKTEVTNKTTEKYVPKVEVIESLNVLVDKFGYIKTVENSSVIRAQAETLESYKYNIEANSEDVLRVFTDKGNMYTLKMKDIPITKMKDKGIPIDTKCGMEKDEYILEIVANNTFKDNDIMYLFKNGTCSRILGEDLQVRTKKTACAKIESEVLGVLIVNNKTKIEIEYDNNKSKVINIKNIEAKKRKQKAIKLLTKKNTVINKFIVDSIDEVAVDSIKEDSK